MAGSSQVSATGLMDTNNKFYFQNYKYVANCFNRTAVQCNAATTKPIRLQKNTVKDETFGHGSCTLKPQTAAV